MKQQRVIIAVGEALMREARGDSEASGLAVDGALCASMLGHVGLAVTRVGQDTAGAEILRRLRSQGLDVQHIQTDPDLPTARVSSRAAAVTQRSWLPARCAFDNLQWDFDLQDVAQRADGVLFGQVARRDGQSRSVQERFLLECPNALRAFDLVSRPDSAPSRGDVLAGLRYANMAIVDDAALRVLAPSTEHVGEARMEVIRRHHLSFLAHVAGHDGTGQLTVCAPDQPEASWRDLDAADHLLFIVAVMLELINGSTVDAGLQAAQIAVGKLIADRAASSS